MEFSVAMPAYNAAPYIGETLSSLSKSHLKPKNIIIVNDGSTDATGDIVKEYKDALPIELIHQENAGISNALNRAIAQVETPLVARLDADDLITPDRFTKQVNYLKLHTDISVLGSSVLEFGAAHGLRQYPSTELGILLRSLSIAPFSHPSIMARTEVLKSNPYDSYYDGLEDHELWNRLILKKYKLTNMPDQLTFYRIHKQQLTQNASTSVREKLRLLKQAQVDNPDFVSYVNTQLKSLDYASPDAHEIASLIVKSHDWYTKMNFSVWGLLTSDTVKLKTKSKLLLKVLKLR